MTDFSSGGAIGELRGMWSMIANSILTAEQWKDMFFRKPLAPEERLCAAILESAIHDVQLEPRPKADDVVKWMRQEHGPFPAFSACCEALRLEPEYLERGIMAVYKKRTWTAADRCPGTIITAVQTLAMAQIGPFTARILRRLPEMAGVKEPQINAALQQLYSEGELRRLRWGWYEAA